VRRGNPRAAAAEFPTDLNWVLADRWPHRPATITTPQFPSNWELSTARPFSVGKYLVDRASRNGLPPRFRRVPALDAAQRRARLSPNRRIEIKLTTGERLRRPPRLL